MLGDTPGVNNTGFSCFKGEEIIAVTENRGNTYGVFKIDVSLHNFISGRNESL